MPYCYLLATESEKTYIGATVDIDRRLRQHNKEISGGARATGIRVAQGEIWNRVCYISGIPEWKSALQIEWKWKQLGRTEFRGVRNPILRRLHSLKKLLELEKPTKNSVPYESYPDGPPNIMWESDYYKELYNTI
jgi:structure-specific endonuclease subunit SLX1